MTLKPADHLRNHIYGVPSQGEGSYSDPDHPPDQWIAAGIRHDDSENESERPGARRRDSTQPEVMVR